MSDLKQWVNLNKDARFVGDGIDSLERLEYLHFECKFKNAKPAFLKVRIVPVGNQANYTKEELNRNKNFRLRITSSHSNDAQKDIKIESDAYLPAAGGNRYKVEAKYRNKTVESKKEIQAWRRLYYQVIAMGGVTVPASLQSFEDDFKNETEKFFIELNKAGSVQGQMKFIKAIISQYDPNTRQSGSLNGQEFRDEARKVYTIGQLQPYSIAVVFSNNIATFEKLPLEIALNKRNNADRRVSFGINELTINVKDNLAGATKYLWHNLSSDDMANDPKDWLVRGTAIFEDQAGRTLNISDNDISVTGNIRGAEGGYSQLRIQLSPAMATYLNNNIVKLKFELRIVRGFSGGFSYNGLNLITVATKAWWDPTDDPDMLQILNHEMGHKIGMVAYGDKKKSTFLYKNNPEFNENRLLPNSPTHLYGENRGVNNQGHLGPHCSSGATYHPPGTATGGQVGSWTGTPLCVMFGATGLQDAVTKKFTVSPKSFCPDCAKVVRKLDLDGSRLDGLKGQF